MSGNLTTTQYVGSGLGNSGTDSNTTILAGGAQYLGYLFGTGTATSTTISSGGAQFVGDSGGTGYATSTTISGGGNQYVGQCFRDRDDDEHNDLERRRTGRRLFRWDRDGDEHDDFERRQPVCRRCVRDRDGDEHDDRRPAIRYVGD